MTKEEFVQRLLETVLQYGIENNVVVKTVNVTPGEPDQDGNPRYTFNVETVPLSAPRVADEVMDQIIGQALKGLIVEGTATVGD